MKIYKIFVTVEESVRLNDSLSRFESINKRIVSDSKGKLFNRIVVELSSEEVMILKIALRADEYLIVEADRPNPVIVSLDRDVENGKN